MIDNIKSLNNTSLNNGRIQFIILNLFDTILTINGLKMGLEEGNGLFELMPEYFFIGKLLLSTIISFVFNKKLLKLLNKVFAIICASNLLLIIIGNIIYLVAYLSLIW